MTAVVIVGAQWGDEGKGKIVDYLTESSDIVVRFQGGNNAGHTLVVNGQKVAVRLVPSGILRPHVRCLLASNVVIDPDALVGEINELKAIGIEVTPARLGIAREANLILPFHRLVDAAREECAIGSSKIGTTKRGVGPAYEDLVGRRGIRMADLLDTKRLESRVLASYTYAKIQVEQGCKVKFDLSLADVMEKLQIFAKFIKPYLVDVGDEISKAKSAGKKIIFEGAQGTMLDVTHGTYPYVTSSHTVAASACVSAGVGTQFIDYVLGVVKAYCTRVGEGPFPTEAEPALAENLRKAGGEFGTVTGRPRRCGWFDAAAAARAVRLNGVTGLFITKLDVLDGFDTIRLGIRYKDCEIFPIADDLGNVEVEYIEVPGWKTDTTGIRKFADLPKSAQTFLEKISEISGSPLVGFSVGPDRTQTIITCEKFSKLVGFSS